VAVDLDLFYRTPGAPSRQTRLLAGRMTVQAGQPIADELLTLDPAPLADLGVLR
jgi:hypothetical protein